MEVAQNSPARTVGGTVVCPLIHSVNAGKFSDELLSFGKWVSYDAESVDAASNIIATIPSGGTVIYLK